MKQAKNILQLFVVLFCCSMTVIASDAGMDKYTVRVNSFQGINVEGACNVYLTRGNQDEIRVETNLNREDVVIKNDKNNTLRIEVGKRLTKSTNSNVSSGDDEGRFLLIGKGENQKKYYTRIYIFVKDLSSIAGAAGAYIKSEHNIGAENISIALSSGAIADLIYNQQTLNLAISSGGVFQGSGKAEYFIIAASSGGVVNGYDVRGEKVTVSASSGAIVNVTAEKQLTANASSGAMIRYKGGVQEIDKNTSSGGTIRRSDD